MAIGQGSEFVSAIYDLDYDDLEALLVDWGKSPVHAREIWRALYRGYVTDFEQMATVPHAIRSRLAATTSFALPKTLAHQSAPDGATAKDLLQLADGEQIEVVLLRYRQRNSACISTQVGCACGCVFCATGQMGFVRQLSSGEIVAQVLHIQRALRARGETLSNFVLMGMGEPLLNYDNTLAAIRRLCDPRGMGFVERRITLSTVGIVPGIERLADEGLRINLAVSLHAATDALRSTLMPINNRYPLGALFAALKHYTKKTQRRVMLEWVMIDGTTDTPEQAEALVAYISGMPTHVNLIRLNPTSDYGAHPSSLTAIDRFSAILDRANVPHTMRQRRGLHIAAGCGQLRGNLIENRNKK